MKFLEALTNGKKIRRVSGKCFSNSKVTNSVVELTVIDILADDWLVICQHEPDFDKTRLLVKKSAEWSVNYQVMQTDCRHCGVRLKADFSEVINE